MPRSDKLTNRTLSKKPMLGLALIGTLCILPLLSSATEVVRVPIKRKGAGPLFQVHYQGKWGFIDRSGEVVIPPRFEDEGDFFGGLARVEIDGKWGYIDERGRVSIPCRFVRAGDFQEGLAAVQSD